MNQCQFDTMLATTAKCAALQQQQLCTRSAAPRNAALWRMMSCTGLEGAFQSALELRRLRAEAPALITLYDCTTVPRYVYI